MNGRNPSTTDSNDTDDDAFPPYPALQQMESRPELQPLAQAREPYWQAPVIPASHAAYIPTWDWRWHRADTLAADDTPTTLASVNGPLDVLGRIRVAHSHLSRATPSHRPLAPRDVLPGYYRIARPTWAFEGTIVHPLGDSSRLETEALIWVAHPTLALLLELKEEGALGEVLIDDAYVAQAATDFSKWAANLRQRRVEILDAIERSATDAGRAAHLARFFAFEDGYAAALESIRTGEGTTMRRPDWTHAIYAEHAAAMWRRAWSWTYTGRPVVAMPCVDELVVLTADMGPVMSRPTPPFTIGHTLGALAPIEDGEDA
ncbi:MAG: hypothetical protein HOV73_01775 [Streptomyces sp.]|nr:hypothetical protein [Streptomyces sp.]